MKGETRRVIHLDASRFGGRQRTAPGPIDNSFFLNSRTKLTGKTLENPYRQHAYFYSAVKRATATLSKAPFILLQETGESSEADPLRTRRDSWQLLCKEFRTLPPALFDIFHGKGEKARRQLSREFYTTVRRFAPTAPLSTLCRAVGVEPIEEGPWWNLFRDVNPEMTRSQLWDATTVYMMTDGESFWIPLKDGKKWEPPPSAVTGAEQAKYIPTEIWPYGKRGWKPIRDPEKKRITAWKLEDKTITETAQTFKSNQIGHFKFFDPMNPARGLAPAEALKIELAQDHNAARYNLAFFERGAQLPWVMVFSNGINPTQKQDVEEQLLRDVTGLDNMHQPAVFDGDAKIEKLGMSQRDMDYYTLRQWVRDEVLAAVGTPKSEMGIFQDVNKASAVISKRVFWDNTLLPLMTYYEDNTDSFLFAPVTGGAVFGAFDTSNIEALREDLVGKAKVAETLWKMGFTADEINERLNLGFDTAAWRQKWWVNQNMVPVSATGERDDVTPEGPDDDGDEGGGGSGDDTGDGGDGGDSGGDGDKPEEPGEEPEKPEGEAFPLVRAPFDEADREAVQLVFLQANRVQRIVDTVRTRMVFTLQKAVAEGATKAKLLDAVRKQFGFVAGASNVGSKALTEAAQMTSIARRVQMQRKRVPQNQWLSARDQRVRDDHKTLDGQVQPVGFNYGELIGSPGVLEFPHDPRAPAEQVVNCRCALIPYSEGATQLWGGEDARERLWLVIVGKVMEPGQRALHKIIHKIFWRIRGAQLRIIGEADLESTSVQALAFEPIEFKEALTELSTPVYKKIWAAALEELEEELAELGALPPAPA